ncbi:MAG: phenylacetate--CoA ligase family protein [Solobacterium sp.]|nr:phenylacetate--CoA ligase family protein [Solobacterium sp.]
MRTPTDAWIASRLGIPLEELTAEALEAYQLKRFRETVRYAAEHSPFYAERLGNTCPDSIQTPADIRRIDVTSELDVAGQENAFLCIAPGSVDRIFTVPTTGTHGDRKRICFTAADLAPSVEFYYHAFLTFIRPGDRLLVMMGGTAEGSVGDTIDRSLSPIGVITHVFGQVTDLETAWNAVLEFAPDVIVGIPYQIAALAAWSRTHGLPQGVRCVLLSADDVPDAIRSRISQLWGSEVYSHYGLTETGLAGGVDCCAHRGYHLRACDMYAEILDPDPDGFGELAVTPFGREAMPLIRYRTGDIARISTERCPCGGVLPRLETIRGRLSNSCTIGGKRVFLREIEEAVYGDNAVIDLECTADGDTLRLTVRTLPQEKTDTEALQEILRREVLPENTAVIIEEETALGFLPERSPKKRMTVRQEE